MKQSPTIDFAEFDHYTCRTQKINGFDEIIRQHPDFGHWQQRSISIKSIHVFEHRAELVIPVNVQLEKVGSARYVHHCISLKGNIGAYFHNHKISANLAQQRYHQIFVPEDDYMLGFGHAFTNVHIEIDREHYATLLSDTEKWSSDLRKKLVERELFYPEENVLTPEMIRTVHEIFNNPLSGSLKQLFIESKVHELIALQLNNLYGESRLTKQRKSDRDLFYSIHDYLSENFLKEHSLKDIGKHFGVNEFSLKKGFRENFQTTIFDFLLNKRLEHAHELLLHMDQTVHEISSLVGYKYPHHFSVAFKKKFGISPSYLKQN